jgi:peptidoglycan hydrolase-like protein with peptidoglycan-binding domain
LLLQGAAALTDIYGLTISQVKALQAFCESNQLVIAVRSRSKRAAQLIRDGLAVGKNEIIKIKNVNEIDRQYLGYSQADLNTIVWAEPVPVEYVFDKLAASGADELTRDIVLQRFYLRQSEWVNPDIRSVINNAEQSKTIAWTLDAVRATARLHAHRADPGLWPQGPAQPGVDQAMALHEEPDLQTGPGVQQAARERQSAAGLVPGTHHPGRRHDGRAHRQRPDPRRRAALRGL